MHALGSVIPTYPAITYCLLNANKAIREDRFCRQSPGEPERFTRRLCFRISGFARRREMHSSPFALDPCCGVRRQPRHTYGFSIANRLHHHMFNATSLRASDLQIIYHYYAFTAFFPFVFLSNNYMGGVRCACEWDRQYRVSLNFVLVSIDQREIFRWRWPPQNIWSSVENSGATIEWESMFNAENRLRLKYWSFFSSFFLKIFIWVVPLPQNAYACHPF